MKERERETCHKFGGGDIRPGEAEGGGGTRGNGEEEVRSLVQRLSEGSGSDQSHHLSLQERWTALVSVATGEGMSVSI